MTFEQIKSLILHEMFGSDMSPYKYGNAFSPGRQYVPIGVLGIAESQIDIRVLLFYQRTTGQWKMFWRDYSIWPPLPFEPMAQAYQDDLLQRAEQSYSWVRSRWFVPDVFSEKYNLT